MVDEWSRLTNVHIWKFNFQYFSSNLNINWNRAYIQLYKFSFTGAGQWYITRYSGLFNKSQYRYFMCTKTKKCSNAALTYLYTTYTYFFGFVVKKDLLQHDCYGDGRPSLLPQVPSKEVWDRSHAFVDRFDGHKMGAMS